MKASSLFAAGFLAPFAALAMLVWLRSRVAQ
jgi:hypothetical protein